MGSCSSKRIILANCDRNGVIEQIANDIERNQIRTLKALIEQYSKTPSNVYAVHMFEIDQEITEIQGFRLNSLAYALRLGRTKVFRLLYENFGASIKAMENWFQQVQKSALCIWAENNLVSLTKYYLPIYLEHRNEILGAKQSKNLDTNDSLSMENVIIDGSSKMPPTASHLSMSAHYTTYTPIQRAALAGNLELVTYYYDQFKNSTEKYAEFDVHAIDEKSGENCAILAARSGNLSLMKYLSEVVTADFSLKNRRSESALQLWIIYNKNKTHINLKNLVKYLVEVAGVDLAYNYEETLLVCDNKEVIDYIEMTLGKYGVDQATKQVVEYKHAIQRQRTSVQGELDLDRRLATLGSSFNFRQVFKEELSDSHAVSSILDEQNEIDDSVTPKSILRSYLECSQVNSK